MPTHANKNDAVLADRRRVAGWHPRAAGWLVWLCLAAMLWAAEAQGQSVRLLDGGDMMVVPVKAFDRPLNFVVDTGFTISAIDTKFESLLGRQINAYTAVSPLGIKTNVPIYQCPAISIAGQPAGLNEIAVLDLTMLRSISGMQCDGILGSDWFAIHVVAINFDDQTLTLEPAPAEIVRNTYRRVAVEPYQGFYAMKALLNQYRVVDLMIDTGDSGSLSLNQDVWSAIFSTNLTNSMDATVADAVNNVAQTEIGVVGQIAVAGVTYTNLHAMLIRNPRHPSRLGLRFFQRHNVTFDFPAGMLYLQPNQNYFIPDVEDMSGLHLLRYDGKTVVYSVNDPSPAAAHGILAQDVIEAINDQPASALTIQTIRQMLRSGDGRPVALRIRRGDALLGVRIVLKKAI